ncbi:tRNA lysidine(34) synthetase TilS [Crocinitomix sp.]|nr:tRNA lysidine(34) synthetase TilS [Crocinitomix sp.]
MLKQFKEIIQSEFNSFKDKNAFLAISGGKDSMTLADLLLEIQIPHTLLHCNFKLRGIDADNDEQFILDFAAKNKLSVFTTQFNTKEYAEANKLTVQEAARNLRYDWFGKILTGKNDVLLTAHHKDDDIETFFINLMRGTSINGLTGISLKRDNIYRPLLNFTQEEILNYVKAKGITFRQDESNFENKYLRNHLRNNIIPILESKSSNFKQKVHRTMESIDAANSWISEQAKIFKSQHFIQMDPATIKVDINLLSQQADIFKEYILSNFDIHRANVPEINKLMNSATGSELKLKSHTFLKNRDELIIQKNRTNSGQVEIQIHELPTELTLSGKELEFNIVDYSPTLKKSNNPQLIDFEKVQLPLTVRKWKQGDRIQPLGMTGNKLISDVLIDKKLSKIEKERVYVIESNGKNLLILNIMISDAVKITDTTKRILSIEQH